MINMLNSGHLCKMKVMKVYEKITFGCIMVQVMILLV